MWILYLVEGLENKSVPFEIKGLNGDLFNWVDLKGRKINLYIFVFFFLLFVE